MVKTNGISGKLKIKILAFSLCTLCGIGGGNMLQSLACGQAPEHAAPTAYTRSCEETADMDFAGVNIKVIREF